MLNICRHVHFKTMRMTEEANSKDNILSTYVSPTPVAVRNPANKPLVSH